MIPNTRNTTIGDRTPLHFLSSDRTSSINSILNFTNTNSCGCNDSESFQQFVHVLINRMGNNLMGINACCPDFDVRPVRASSA
ncbi:MAG: hypothetical protein ACHBN1_26070 [Heteroscytonema crispum UTEX LB 1556]